MVNNVANLTRSIRDGYLKKEALKHRIASAIPGQRHEIERQLSEKGDAIFTDGEGNRFLIERKLA